MEPFKISVPLPLIVDDHDTEKYLRMLKEMHAWRVFLIAPFDSMYRETVRMMRDRYGEKVRKVEEKTAGNTYPREVFAFWSEMLREKIRLYQENGIEVGFWMGYTIGHGGDLSGDVSDGNFTQITSMDGREAKGCFCPLDPGFVGQITGALSEIAKSGVKYILLDDDFRLNDHSVIQNGCFCPLHVAYFNRLNGLHFTREDIVGKALGPENNPYRKMWFDSLGKSLCGFADKIQKAVHKENPDARLGIAIAPSLWGSEGADAVTLLRHLNGKTKPFLRIAGAPYWDSANALKVGSTVEYNKDQLEWLKDEEIDVMCEGDTFPHNRYACGAGLLLSYNAGVLATGAREIFDYVFAYSTRADYETGYTRAVIENREYLNRVSEMFDGGKNVGLNIVHRKVDIEKARFPENPRNLTKCFNDPVILDFLTRMGVPIGTEGGYPYFLYAGNVYDLTKEDFAKIRLVGAIVDIDAALALKKKGIDVGLRSAAAGHTPTFEVFENQSVNGDYQGERIFLPGVGESDPSGIYYECSLETGCRVVGQFADRSKILYPSVYLYKNADGSKYMVYTFNISKAIKQGQLLYGYARQQQLANSSEYLSGKIMDAVVCSQPNLHLMCKTGPGSLSVGIQNLSQESFKSLTLRLPPYRAITQVTAAVPGCRAAVSPDYRYNRQDKYGYLDVRCPVYPLDFLSLKIQTGSQI